MTQLSAPVNKRPFRVDEWRYAIGNEPGVKEDNDGTGYDIELSTNSDEAIIGSATEDSATVVGGGMHAILAGKPERIEIPPAINGPRTDLLTVRYNPEWAFVPAGVDPVTWIGPCRLHRIEGTESSGVPPYDGGPPGVEDEVLYEVTRTPGTALSSSGTVVVNRRIRTGPHLYAERTDTPFPAAPLGTQLRRGYGPNARTYNRVLDDQGAPVWQEFLPPRDVGAFTRDTAYTILTGQEATTVYRQGGRCYLTGAVYQRIKMSFVAGGLYTLGTIPAEFAPAAGVLNFPAHFKNTFATIQVVAPTPGVLVGLVQIIPSIALADRPAGEIVTHLSGISWVAR